MNKNDPKGLSSIGPAIPGFDVGSAIDQLFYDFSQSISNSINSATDKVVSGIDNAVTGFGMGAEAHALYGYGRDTFFCCDTENNRWRIRTSKHCLGAALLLSGGGIATPCKSNRKKCPDGYGGFALEAGAFIFEGSVGFGKDGLLPNFGIGGGAGGKFTVCYYRILEKDKIGCCK